MTWWLVIGRDEKMDGWCASKPIEAETPNEAINKAQMLSYIDMRAIKLEENEFGEPFAYNAANKMDNFTRE